MKKTKQLYDLSKSTFTRLDFYPKHLQNKIQIVIEFWIEM